MKSQESKIRVVLDFGPSTMIMLAQILLVVLKIAEYIIFPWWLILLPTIVIMSGTAVILLSTLMKVIKNSLF